MKQNGRSQNGGNEGEKERGRRNGLRDTGGGGGGVELETLKLSVGGLMEVPGVFAWRMVGG